jgi:voltage-gated sodium channel
VSAPAKPNRLWRLVESPIFVGFILAVIIANAVVLGLQTYDEIEEQYGDTLALLNGVCLAIFVGELALRIGAYGRRPWSSSAPVGTSSTSS